MPKDKFPTINVETDITKVDGGGPDRKSKLYYSGYDIEDLVARGVPFEAIAYLLMHGDLPTEENRALYEEFITKWNTQRDLPGWLPGLIENLKEDVIADPTF